MEMRRQICLHRNGLVLHRLEIALLIAVNLRPGFYSQQ